eukprot:1158713-Amphidinium_carterae.1
MDAGFDFRRSRENRVMSPNAQERGSFSSVPFNPFASAASAARELRALEMVDVPSDALVSASNSDLVPLGGLGGLGLETQTFSLATPSHSRNGTPRSDPQLSWFAGALHASMQRQAVYRDEMLEQEQNRAQDAQRFEQASAWVFQQGRT